ncbi:Fanconi anemia group F protein [Pelobates fuscus]|uniref:Fanconi anemia group F protein n=1 Tax=Pelobates fuscus TaxID=191477 RepID=UPI002FE4C218
MTEKKESLLQNLDHFIELLAVSRSVYVKNWDILSVKQGLKWGTYFKHIHKKFNANDAIKTILEDFLQLKNVELAACTKNYQHIQFDNLGQSVDMLCTNLLLNRALPKSVFKFLISQLSDDTSKTTKLCGVNNIVSQKAALQLLLPFPQTSSDGLQDPLEDPLVLTQAEMLKSYLEDKFKTVGKIQQSACVSDVLSGISQPHVYYLLASVLISNIDTVGLMGLKPLSQLLLEWLLANSNIWPDFCSNLRCQSLTRLSCKYPMLRKPYLDFLTTLGRSMEQDFVSGNWVSTSMTMNFNVFLEHFECLMEGGEDLKAATETMLKTLKMEGGDFDVPGVNIWTDLLLEINKT